MKEKIESQLADVESQMSQAAQNYRDILAGLSQQQLNLQQALVLAAVVPPDVQTILDDAAK